MEKISENKEVKKILEVVYKDTDANIEDFKIESWQDVIDHIEGFINDPFDYVKHISIENRLILGFCVRLLTANIKGRNNRVADLSEICRMKESTAKAYEYVILYTFEYLDNIINWENPENPIELVPNKENFNNFKWYLRLFLETIPYNHTVVTKDVRILRSMTNYQNQEVLKYQNKPHKMRSTVLKAKSGIGALMHEIRALELKEDE